MHRLDPNYTSEALKKLIEIGQEKAKELIDAFEEDPASVEVGTFYTKFKDDLIACQNGNCAYCEQLVSGHPGDVEHYRPKNRVTLDSGKVLTIKHPKHGEMNHPGYFWRAYSWDNLFLSCGDCNKARYHSDQDGRTKFGKQDRFDILGKRAVDPCDDLNDELPLLVHPVDGDPQKDLTLDGENLYQAHNDRGQYTIDLLGLNRRADLIERRSVALERGQLVVWEFLDAVKNEKAKKQMEKAELLQKIIDGSIEFLSAYRLGLFGELKKLDDLGVDLKIGELVQKVLKTGGDPSADAPR
ncbi:hypothetical protein SPOA0125 (plasmid) [Ruegeria pomeroyi DSS-3]|jgi:5-methylcytosine-specific restriction endonuclease McrA|uniref:HNH domain-containing protein n=2 Tax=Ruegeria pomeroyi TaxID=89184 RepID=Q5LLA1_RUEPO|nr:hypothetical protein [Ruegeria pomeroyi]AAV97262.1 hypothetical protein SPOA0125 [Ruegeria pomeroyi DSS-3]NVK98150.1 hypothetical protein [Ruegeria pomeroyi]NVL03299.1 hypothetical protein [Ruegeria pomeroyi]HCE72881.1 hypothetical protein [Ruegeria sp.]